LPKLLLQKRKLPIWKPFRQSATWQSGRRLGVSFEDLPYSHYLY
jgi:hypothetical protein